MQSIKFQDLKDLFLENRIYLDFNNKPRLTDDDLLFFSDNFEIEPYVCILRGSCIPSMGAFTYTSTSDVNIKIGRYCSLANITFFGARHPLEFISTSPFNHTQHVNFFSQPYLDRNISFNNKMYRGQGGGNGIVIGNDVWVAQNVTMKYGINIGHGAVIAANTLLTKDVPPYAIIGGVPGKVIKYRFDMDIVNKLLDISWWNYHIADLNGLPWHDPIDFILKFEDRVKYYGLTKYEPKKLLLKDLLNYKE